MGKARPYNRGHTLSLLLRNNRPVLRHSAHGTWQGRVKVSESVSTLHSCAGTVRLIKDITAPRFLGNRTRKVQPFRLGFRPVDVIVVAGNVIDYVLWRIYS